MTTAPAPDNTQEPPGQTPYVYPFSYAICTLGDTALQEALAARNDLQGVIIAPLTTENLGIEQIIAFCLSQPGLRTLLVCGEDARQAIGYRAGQTLVALMANGVDADTHRIVGAEGKRPLLKNLTPEAIAHFRNTVTVVDLVDTRDLATVLDALANIQNTPVSPSNRFTGTITTQPDTLPHVITDEPTDTIVMDPAGYFVISICGSDPSQPLQLTHYMNDGTPQRVFMGRNAKALMGTLIDHQVVSRLDHAAYLGAELERALHCLQTGETYVQG